MQHHSQTNDLRARLEVTEWAAFRHPATLLAHPARFNQVCYDKALARACGGVRWVASRVFGLRAEVRLLQVRHQVKSARN